MPPDALAQWQQWDIVDPGYLGVMVAWWPVDTFLRLAILAWLLRAAQPALALRTPQAALPAAINAELLLSLRSGIVCLLGLVPALALLALAGVETVTARLGLLALTALGLIPALTYYLGRNLAPVALLRHALRGGEALDWSRDHLSGPALGRFFYLAAPWWMLSALLEAGAWGLSQLDAWPWQALNWLLTVPSLLAALLPLALFVTDDRA